MDYKISILVAIYNTAPYLRKCLDSLVNQTLKEIQIICIDDASTDNSLSILREYEKLDERIIVLTQSENQGHAKARNKGLEFATGEFITMTDSDDWLSLDALEKAYNIILQYPNADTVLFDLHSYYGETGEYIPHKNHNKNKTCTGEEALLLSLDWQIHGIYITRNTIHKAYPYDETSRMYSDENTCRLHYLKSREVHFCSGIYYYRRHSLSNTSVHNIRRFDRIEAAISLKSSLKKEKVSDDIIIAQENQLWLIIINSYIFYLKYKKIFTPKEKKEIFERIKKGIYETDTSLLYNNIKYKFGHIPFKRSFMMFRLQEWLYWRLRDLYYRVRGKKFPYPY